MTVGVNSVANGKRDAKMRVKVGDKMYQQFAQGLTSFFWQKIEGDVSGYVTKITRDQEEQKQVFYYGAGLLISSTITLIASFIMAGILWEIGDVLLFYSFFLPLRSTAGGYHARSYGMCTISFLVCFFLGNVLITYNSALFGKWLLIVSVIIVFCLAPVEDCNKPLSMKKQKKMKGISRKILLSEIGIILFAPLDLRQRAYAVWAIVFVAALLFAGKIGNNIIHEEK